MTLKKCKPLGFSVLLITNYTVPTLINILTVAHIVHFGKQRPSTSISILSEAILMLLIVSLVTLALVCRETVYQACTLELSSEDIISRLQKSQTSRKFALYYTLMILRILELTDVSYTTARRCHTASTYYSAMLLPITILAVIIPYL